MPHQRVFLGDPIKKKPKTPRSPIDLNIQNQQQLLSRTTPSLEDQEAADFAAVYSVTPEGAKQWVVGGGKLRDLANLVPVRRAPTPFGRERTTPFEAAHILQQTTASLATLGAQSLIPGEQEQQHRFRDIKALGENRIRAALDAYRQTRYPRFTKGAIEAGTDIANIIPGVGFTRVGGAIERAAFQAGKVGRGVQKAAEIAAKAEGKLGTTGLFAEKELGGAVIRGGIDEASRATQLERLRKELATAKSRGELGSVDDLNEEIAALTRPTPEPDIGLQLATLRLERAEAQKNLQHVRVRELDKEIEALVLKQIPVSITDQAAYDMRIAQAKGRWFSHDIRQATEFAISNGGAVWFVDVPRTILPAAQKAASAVSGSSEIEFLLPLERIKGARLLSELGESPWKSVYAAISTLPPVKEGEVRLFRGTGAVERLQQAALAAQAVPSPTDVAALKQRIDKVAAKNVAVQNAAEKKAIRAGYKIVASQASDVERAAKAAGYTVTRNGVDRLRAKVLSLDLERNVWLATPKSEERASNVARLDTEIADLSKVLKSNEATLAEKGFNIRVVIGGKVPVKRGTLPPKKPSDVATIKQFTRAARQPLVDEPSILNAVPDTLAAWTMDDMLRVPALDAEYTRLKAAAADSLTRGEVQTAHDILNIDIPMVEEELARLSSKLLAYKAPSVETIVKELNVDITTAKRIRTKIRLGEVDLTDFQPLRPQLDSGVPYVSGREGLPPLPPESLIPPGIPGDKSPQGMTAALKKLDATYGAARMPKQAHDLMLLMSDADVPALGALRKQFNFAKQFWAPIVREVPELQFAVGQAYNYAGIGARNVANTHRYFTTVLKDAGFTPEQISGGLVSGAVYKGDTGPAFINKIGTIFDITQYPELYDLSRLSQKQRDALMLIPKEFDADLSATVATTGAAIGKVESLYLPHMTKKPMALPKTVVARVRRGVASSLRTRDLKFRADFYNAVHAGGGEVETDMNVLIYKRLSATARLRSDTFLLDTYAKKIGGTRVKTSDTIADLQEELLANMEDLNLTDDMVAQLRANIGPGDTTIPAGFQNFVHPSIPGLAWQLPTESASDLQKLLTAPYTKQELLSSIIDVGRELYLNLDVSAAVARQGFSTLTAMASNPLPLLRAWYRAGQMAVSPEMSLIRMADDADRIMWWQARGLEVGRTPLDIQLQRGLGTPTSFLKSIPVFGAVPRTLEHVQFDVFLLQYKTIVAEHMLDAAIAMKDGHLGGFIQKLATRDDALGALVGGLNKVRGGIDKMSVDDLAKMVSSNVNNFLGGLNWGKISTGQISAITKLLLLTPSWTRAQIGLHIDALTKLGPEGAIARRLVIAQMAIAGFVAGGINALTGNDYSFDPRSSQFSRIYLPNNVSFQLNPTKAYIDAIATFFTGKREDEMFEDQTALDQRLEAIGLLAAGRAGQLVTVAKGLTTGTDFYGRHITNRGVYVGQQTTPIAAGAILQQLDDPETDESKLATVAILAFAGANTTPLPMRDRLEKWLNAAASPEAKQAFDEIQRGRKEDYPALGPWDGKWESLMGHEKKAITHSSEGFRISVLYGDTDTQRWRAREQSLVTQGKIAEAAFARKFDEYGFPYDGEDFRRDVGRIKAQVAQMRSDKEGILGKIIRSPKDENEVALRDYLDLVKPFATYDANTGDIVSVDVDRLQEAQMQFKAALAEKPNGEVIKQYISANTNTLLTPLARELDNDEEKYLFAYYNVMDAKVPPELQKQWKQYKRSNGSTQRALGLATPMLFRLEQEEQVARWLMRRDNPELDRVLQKWGYVERPVLETAPPGGSAPTRAYKSRSFRR